MNNIEIVPMTQNDLNEVYALQSISMHLNWSQKVWMEELTKSQIANHFVARINGHIVGFAGFWMIYDEANIVNIVVHPSFRNLGIGTKLLYTILKNAKEKNAKFATLEVRASNTIAIKLYEKFGFKLIAIRKKYYENPEEDGYVYWLNPLVLPDEINIRFS
jgi:ribosomal-protein-alanine N-acetyltransferase